MADMVVVSNRTQALALPYHSDCLALLVSGQLWLASEFDGSLLRGGAATTGTSKNAASFVLRQSRQERQNALTERRGQIQPLPIESLEGRSSCGDALNDANSVQHRP